MKSDDVERIELARPKRRGIFAGDRQQPSRERPRILAHRVFAELHQDELLVIAHAFHMQKFVADHNFFLFQSLKPLRKIRQRNHAQFAVDALRRPDAANRDAAFRRQMAVSAFGSFSPGWRRFYHLPPALPHS